MGTPLQPVPQRSAGRRKRRQRGRRGTADRTPGGVALQPRGSGGGGGDSMAGHDHRCPSHSQRGPEEER
eukprot:13147179-Heterocapsa_arctica.AAC.1